VSPVSTLRAVTVAPGIIAPLESFTDPVICAFCAIAEEAERTQIISASKPTNHVRIKASLPFGRCPTWYDRTNSNRCEGEALTNDRRD
jgi:hypothetical protein